MTEEAASAKSTKLLYVFAPILGAIMGWIGAYLPPVQYIIVLIILAVAVVAILSDAVTAVSALVVLVPLISYRFQLGPAPIDIVAICTAAVIVAYMMGALKSRENGSASPFTLAFLSFFLFASISAVVAPVSTEAVMVLIRFAGYFLLVFVTGRSVKSKSELDKIIVLMVFAGVVSAVYGIYQYAQPGENTFYDYSMKAAGGSNAVRVSSTFGNPNFYAEYLVLLIPIAVALFLTSRNPLRKTLAGAAVVLFTGNLILTYTRGSWLAVGGGMALMSVIASAWFIWVYLISFGLSILFNPGIAARVISISDIAEGTAAFRIRLWNIAMGIIRDHPLVGVGIGNFYEAFTGYVFKQPELSVGWVTYGAHNSYLTVWAETGIFGIVSFIAVILVSLKLGIYLTNVKRGDRYMFWFSLAFLSSITGFALNGLTSNNFHHPQAAVFFWLLLGLQFSLYNLQAETVSLGESHIFKSGRTFRIVMQVCGSLRSAGLNHPLYGILLSLRRLWQESLVANWLFKPPPMPAIFSGSRLREPVLALLQRARLWLDESIFYSELSTNSMRAAVLTLIFFAASFFAYVACKNLT